MGMNDSVRERVFDPFFSLYLIRMWLMTSMPLRGWCFSWIMPDMNGGETFDQIRSINGSASVLLSSGYSLSGEAKDIIERGCNGFIQKPFDLEILS